jgi:hypothetical protein
MRRLLTRAILLSTSLLLAIAALKGSAGQALTACPTHSCNSVLAFCQATHCPGSLCCPNGQCVDSNGNVHDLLMAGCSCGTYESGVACYR